MTRHRHARATPAPPTKEPLIAARSDAKAPADPKARHPPVAILLAGGRSRRMGRDKAEVVVGARTSLTRVAAAAASFTREIAVVGRDGAPVGAATVTDLVPHGGPLQAIVAAFRAYAGRRLLVVACDLPLLGPTLVRTLTAPLPAGADARVPRDAGGHPQPLCALYAPSARAAFEAAHAAGRRAVTAVLDDLSVSWLTAARLPPEARRGLRDFDTPADLEALLDAEVQPTSPE